MNQRPRRPPKPQWTLLCLTRLFAANLPGTDARLRTHSLYIPLADHDAALLAYPHHQDRKLHTHFRIGRIKNGDLLRTNLQSGKGEIPKEDVDTDAFADRHFSSPGGTPPGQNGPNKPVGARVR